jgi:CubicO group peptidase (beta-lactamase class C family)
MNGVLLAAFLLLGSGAGGLARGADAEPLDPVYRTIQGWIDRGYYPGASLLVAQGDRVLGERYFGSFKPDSVVYIASAGKWLAAATIAAVVDEGKLAWDDPASKWLPERTGAKGRATLRQLLSHTAGYPDYQPAGRHRDDYQTLAESVAQIVPLPADTEPGKNFHYGGLAMQVAGRMAELATGRDWETLFQEKIARPLSMADTHFTPVDSGPGHSPMLGGGARSTLRDYARFLEMIAHDGVFRGRRVLSAAAIGEMEADQVRGARVEPGREFVERVRRAKHQGIYGLGEWREQLDERGEAVLLSSPSWAGAYPWIDKTCGVWGIFLAHVDTAAAAKDKFNAFYASPELAMLVRQAVQARRQ